MIKPPTLPLCHPDRKIECEMALEADNFALLDRGRDVQNEEFRTLALRATAAGWSGEEVGAAMISLALKYVSVRRHQRTNVPESCQASGDGA